MKKKILHVSAGGLNRGGVSSVIYSITRSLYPNFNFGFVVFNRKSEEEQEFQKYGTLHRIHCYPRKGKRNYLELVLRPFKLYLGILKICKKESYSVIHCHNQHDAFPCLLAAKHANVPIRISHAHVGSDSRKTYIERMHRKICARYLNRFSTIKVACSTGAGRVLFGNDVFEFIPNGIDLTKFTPNGEEKKDNYTFLHVGRFTYAKNQEFVIKTFSEIKKKIKEARLFLVGYGDSDEVSRLEALINKTGISESIEMIPGDTADIFSCYAMADYLIFPSRFEGFPVTLIEAQAMNLICYASNVITEEADVGLVTFLKLSDGPEKWAEKIVSDIKNNREQTLDTEKLLQYSNESISKKFAAIYNGELSSQ